MPFQVTYRGLAVTCTDAHEIDQLADWAGRKTASPSTIHEVVSKLGELSRRFLKILLDTRVPILQSALAKSLGLKESQLPGVITSVSQGLKKAGFSKSDVLHVSRANGKEGERIYSLAPGAIDSVRTGLQLK